MSGADHERDLLGSLPDKEREHNIVALDLRHNRIVADQVTWSIQERVGWKVNTAFGDMVHHIPEGLVEYWDQVSDLRILEDSSPEDMLHTAHSQVTLVSKQIVDWSADLQHRLLGFEAEQRANS